MNILQIASEVAPFAKTGGLADVTGSLPKDLNSLGENCIIVMPKYGFIDVEYYNIKPTFLTLNVPMGPFTEFAHLWKGELPDSNVPVYFVEHEEYYNRAGIYGENSEYFDNDRRFIFLSRCAFEVAKAIDFVPDIIHAHDYHTAFAMAFLKSYYRFEERFSRTAGIFTIHNLAYQGKFNPYRAMDISGFGMKEFYPGSWFEHYGATNSMKVGIQFADKITTVSPTYANEIKMHYFGEGLHDVLSSRSSDLIGILNGVDYNIWNPRNDDSIFGKLKDNMSDFKNTNKVDIFNFWKISDSDVLNKPLIGMVSRLTEQKGIDLLRETLDYYLSSGKINFALLGSGEPQYVDFFNYIKWKFPSSAIINIGYDESFAHKVIAASDFQLLPSRFEPCGLTQMYALKYGNLPIVRNTGGLADTVNEYSYSNKSGNGIVFNNYDGDDLSWAIDRAIDLYSQPTHLNNARENAINCDYSSLESAKKYLDVYKWSVEKFK